MRNVEIIVIMNVLVYEFIYFTNSAFIIHNNIPACICYLRSLNHLEGDGCNLIAIVTLIQENDILVSQPQVINSTHGGKKSGMRVDDKYVFHFI